MTCDLISLLEGTLSNKNRVPGSGPAQLLIYREKLVQTLSYNRVTVLYMEIKCFFNIILSLSSVLHCLKELG